MAFSTNDAINVFGSQAELSNSTSLIAGGEWSAGATDMPLWTNTDDALEAALTFSGSLASAAAAGTSIDVYIQKMNVANTTDDDLEPDNGFMHTFVGSFDMDVGTTQLLTIDIPLPNYKTSSEYVFWIKNGTTQQLSALWELWITPKGIGPKA